MCKPARFVRTTGIVTGVTVVIAVVIVALASGCRRAEPPAGPVLGRQTAALTRDGDVGAQIVDFEQLALLPLSADVITDQFSYRGVTFTGDPVGAQIITVPFPHDRRALRLGSQALGMTFSVPVSRLGVLVANEVTATAERNVVLTGYDASGAQVASKGGTLLANDDPYPAGLFLQISATGATIVRATVTDAAPGADNTGLLVDDVEFVPFNQILLGSRITVDDSDSMKLQATVRYQPSRARALSGVDQSLVVWGGDSVQCRVVAPDGTPASSTQQISAGAGSWATVSTPGLLSGRSVAAWAVGTGVRARMIKPDGTPDGPEIEVVSRLSQAPVGVKVVARDLPWPDSRKPGQNDQFLVVWQEPAVDGTWRLKTSFVRSDSAVSNPAEPLPSLRLFPQNANISVDYAAVRDRFLVTFVKDDPSRGVGAAWLQVTDKSVVADGAAIDVSPAGHLATETAVAFSPEAGAMMVAWTARTSADQLLSQIFGRLIKTDGSFVTGPLSITNQASDRELAGGISIAHSPALGEFLVAWVERNAVMGRTLNNDGSMPRAAFELGRLGDLEFDESAILPSVTAMEPDSDVRPGPTAGTFIPNRYGFLVNWTQISGDTPGISTVYARTVDAHLDSDGDALLDDWETTGVDLNNDGRIEAGVDLLLPTLDPTNPPDVRRKDAYLELDWMACSAGGCPDPQDTHDHRFGDENKDGVPDPVAYVVAKFAEDHAPAKLRNPDPTAKGINLHVDYGQMGGGGPIPDDQDQFLPERARDLYLAANRRRVFRWGVINHLRPPTRTTLRGVGFPGGWFWVWGGCAPQTGTDECVEAAEPGFRTAVFMHELGHTFSLGHGGIDDAGVDNTNLKFNYLSVMNYMFGDGVLMKNGGRLIDYSRFRLRRLDEQHLDESQGIGLEPATSALRTVAPQCGGTSLMVAPADLPIDWNCNGTIETTIPPVDLDRDGIAGTVWDTSSDWDRMIFNHRVGDGYGALMVGPAPGPEPGPDPGTLGPPPTLALSLSATTPTVAAGQTAHLVAAYTSTGPAIALNAVLKVSFADGSQQSFSIGDVPPGATGAINIDHLIAAGTAAGSFPVQAVLTFDNLFGSLQPSIAASATVTVSSLCGLTIVENAYDGPEWWGTIVIQNEGPGTANGFAVAFDVPAGRHCTNDFAPPGATLSPLSGSGPDAATTSNHCVFTWTSATSLPAGQTLLFNYSTDSQNFAAADSVAVTAAGGCNACMAESRAAFCTRLGKTCGPVTAPDNCGIARTVDSCGTCAPGSTCGGAGTPGVCGASPGACTLDVTRNSYDGAAWWGTVTFRNSGSGTAASYRVEFDVPTGAHCTADSNAIPPGGVLSPLVGRGLTARTRSNHCVFTWASGPPLGPGASKTFHYSSDSQQFSAASEVVVRSTDCR